MLRASVVAIALTAAGGASARADSAGPSAFADGVRHYERAQYEAARVAFERSVRAQPGVSEYHHWLGKAYGRLAERANPFAALGLARKTRRAFERAVALDEDNAAAIESLALYYERAPAMLGGDRARAAALRGRLTALRRILGPGP